MSPPGHILVKNASWKVYQLAYAYAFVIGGGGIDVNRTKTLHQNQSQDFLTPTSHKESLRCHSTLHHKENGRFGKSPTWFRYATLVTEEQKFPVDSIIKTDGDTLVIPKRFIRRIREALCSTKGTH
jgi:hypothetical protein